MYLLSVVSISGSVPEQLSSTTDALLSHKSHSSAVLLQIKRDPSNHRLSDGCGNQSAAPLQLAVVHQPSTKFQKNGPSLAAPCGYLGMIT